MLAIPLTDDERRLLLKVLEAQTKSHAERGRTRKIIDAFKLAKLRAPDEGVDNATTTKSFEIDETVRKGTEEVCKLSVMQGSPFLQAMLYDMGEKFNAPKSED